MITVSILINGEPIFTRTARNQSEVNDKKEHLYIVDDGSEIYHARKDGAVKLAKKMLDTIKDENL